MIRQLLIYVLMACCIIPDNALGQQLIEVEGPIIIKEMEDPEPAEGTIRYNAEFKDFEGWNGLFWASLTGNKIQGTVTDIDGNEYKTIKINDQVWMAENLRVRAYNDGRGIPGVLNGWEDVTFAARCSYDNNEDLVDTFGYLYNWYAAGSAVLCPLGWHIPSTDELTILIEFLGESEYAGGRLKHAEQDYWYTENLGFISATNEVGFSGLPAGLRKVEGEFGSLGSFAGWWTSTESFNISQARSLILRENSNRAEILSSFKVTGYSVRCVQDSD